MKISIDLETYCELDIGRCGAYKYANHDSFEILIMCYSVHDSFFTGVHTIDFLQDPEAYDKAKLVYESATVIQAHNANFERICLERYFGEREVEYECSMVKSAYCGLPLALGQLANALKLESGKDARGNALIRLFSMPQKPSKKNNFTAVRYTPDSHPNEWLEFLAYCEQDVRVELEVSELLANIKIPDIEKRIWKLDYKINMKGVYLDTKFVQSVIKLEQYARSLLIARACELTGLANPNSGKQLMEWLNSTIEGETVTSLKKADVANLIAEYGGNTNAEIDEVLKLRQQLSKSSVKKYVAMLETANRDRRIRGLFQYYGANRTGRWSGRLVQLQNLPQGKFKEEEIDELVEYHKKAIIELDPESYVMTYGYEQIQDVLSSLIRSSFIAPKDKMLLVADLSAIEARVLAWLANEKWRLDVFATHGKIYEASASKMFKIPLEEVTKEVRSKGKVAELALGYQGGAGALVSMGALDMGLEMSELDPIKELWRKSNPNIVAFWTNIDNAIKLAFTKPKGVQFGVFKIRILKLSEKLWFLQIKLPSGRSLYYVNPIIVKGQVHYWGLDDKKKWSLLSSYGGKWTENLCQSVARDVIADILLRADEWGFDLMLHVHDEVAAEGESYTLQELIELMGEPIDWAEGLPLKADGFVSKFYRK